MKAHHFCFIDAGVEDQRDKGVLTPRAAGLQARACPTVPYFLWEAGTWERLGWNMGLDGWELEGLGGVPALQNVKGHMPP